MHDFRFPDRSSDRRAKAAGSFDEKNTSIEGEGL
jgi:hypothetical protein